MTYFSFCKSGDYGSCFFTVWGWVSRTSFTTSVSVCSMWLVFASWSNIQGMFSHWSPCTPHTLQACFHCIFLCFLRLRFLWFVCLSRKLCLCSPCLYLSITISASLSQSVFSALCGYNERFPWASARCALGCPFCADAVFLCACIRCLSLPLYAQQNAKKHCYVTLSSIMGLFLSS